MNTTKCQQAVFEAAMELARQDKRLAELASALPLPGDFDLDVLPSTVEIELYSRIQAVKTDYLQPGIVVLMEAAQLSDADLRLEFARDEEKRRRSPLGAQEHLLLSSQPKKTKDKLNRRMAQDKEEDA
jgi:hypothetical protein